MLKPTQNSQDVDAIPDHPASRAALLSLPILVLAIASDLSAGDWPMWRYDANRSANAPHELPADLRLLWTRKYPKRVQVWDDPLNHDLMPYDKVFEPIVLGKRMFVGFNDSDKVIALDTETGKLLWVFHTNGPVRLPPVAWRDKVYFTSDDGYLYCVRADSGERVWSARGGPSERKVLGNKRVVSSWPARGGPVIRDGVVYFAAGIWPFMGTFIHALDAETGRRVWINDETGAQYVKQPHNALSFAGVAPQGALVATKDVLLLPGGRSAPAAFDRKTGRFRYFLIGGKGTGGSFVASGEYYFHVHTRGRGTVMFDLRTGKRKAYRLNEPVIAGDVLYTTYGSMIVARPYAVLGRNQLGREDTLPRDKWKVLNTDSEEPGNEATKAFDGNFRTLWHTAFKTKRPKHPHEIVIDLAKEQKTSGFIYVPSQYVASGWIRRFELYLSNDPKQFGEPVIAGEFPPTALPKEHAFAPRTARYVKFVAKTAIRSSDSSASIAELHLLDAGKTELTAQYRNRVARTWEIHAPAEGDLIRSGRNLYAGGKDAIRVVRLPQGGNAAEVTKSIPVKGNVARLLAADAKLFAVMLDGSIMAYGAAKPSSSKVIEERVERPLCDAKHAESVQYMVRKAGSEGGYALCVGLDEPRLIESLLAESRLNLVVIGRDAASVKRVRATFEKKGVYGKRIAIHPATPSSFNAPPYMFPLILVGRDFARRHLNQKSLRHLYASLRPYGGSMLIPHGDGNSDPEREMLLRDWIRNDKLPKAKLEVSKYGIWIVREGRLPGAASWTHQSGGIANTRKSDDRRVKLPLGVLWFGGNSNMDVLPRHGHGPPQQVINGRLFIQGMDGLSARDVYTGRVLWKRAFKNLGTSGIYFDGTYANTPLSTRYNQRHIPGANARGANYVATAEALYLAAGNACLVLDPKTGKTVRTILMPQRKGRPTPTWAFIGVYEDVLLGGRDFAKYDHMKGADLKKDATSRQISDYTYRRSENFAASRELVAFNRHSGKHLWDLQARYGFTHNGIAAGNGRVHCLDRNPSHIAKEQRAITGKIKPGRIVSADIRTGTVQWQTEKGVFGSWLSYSEKHDVLLQAGARYRDRLYSEVGRGMTAYRGRSGEVLWQKPEIGYGGPCMIHGKSILTASGSTSEGSGAIDLLTGKPRLITNPITQQTEAFRFERGYGCNTPIASEHLMTFRSGAAGFYDLERMGGTGNLGGFKSGCTANLIVADGVLNAPDYTRTCSCAYQNQTSLGLIHMPEAEVWTYSEYGEGVKSAPVRRVGVNLGAPGDRKAENGTLWLDHPNVSGPSPAILVEMQGKGMTYFLDHSARLQKSTMPWISASGARNIRSLTVHLSTMVKMPLPGGRRVALELSDGKLVLGRPRRLRAPDGPVKLGIYLSGIRTESPDDMVSCTLRFPRHARFANDAEIIFSAEASDSPQEFSKDMPPLSTRKATANAVKWRPTIRMDGDVQLGYETPDLSPVLREVMKRPGWKPGHPVVLFLECNNAKTPSPVTAGDVDRPALHFQMRTIRTSRPSGPASRYNVHLHFCEPDGLKPGQRIFDVKVQGRTALSKFDIAREAQGVRREVIRTIKGVAAEGALTISLEPQPGQEAGPVLCGVEIIEATTAEPDKKP